MMTAVQLHIITPCVSKQHLLTKPTMKLEMEDENDAHVPLLIQEQSNEDAILSQLLVASDADKAHASTNNKCCCKAPKDKEIIGLFLFAILTWLGFVLTLFTTYSCDLIHVTWNPHSIHLSVTGVGIRRFQETTRQPKLRVKIVECFDQASYIQHAEISNTERFFPTDEFVKTTSMVAPALSGAVFAGVLIYMIVASINVDRFTNTTTNPQYPWKTITLCYALAGFTLVGAGTAELLVILDLLDVADYANNNHESPICNAEYSTCQLGTGGKLAVFGVACCYAGALLAFFSAFVTVRAKRSSGASPVVEPVPTLGSLS